MKITRLSSVVVSVGAVLVIHVATMSGQQPRVLPGSAPAFEVASIKPNRSGSLGIGIDIPGGDRFTATNVPLRELIRFAYDVQDVRLIGGPDWIRSERFDVVAKAEGRVGAWTPAGPPMPLLLMVRTLLSDRFGLVVHPETRELPIYALTIARDDRKFGPELRASTLDCERQPAGPPAPRPGAAVDQPTCGMRIAPGQMVIGGASMERLATVLSQFVQRPVIDRTKLGGTFDFRLSWTPERLSPGPPPPGAPLVPAVDPNGPTLFTALQEQLGLKLESQQAPLDVLVIDRVERPSPD
jgi:bla regulator protein blaR1